LLLFFFDVEPPLPFSLCLRFRRLFCHAAAMLLHTPFHAATPAHAAFSVRDAALMSLLLCYMIHTRCHASALLCRALFAMLMLFCR